MFGFLKPERLNRSRRLIRHIRQRRIVVHPRQLIQGVPSSARAFSSRYRHEIGPSLTGFQVLKLPQRQPLATLLRQLATALFPCPSDSSCTRRDFTAHAGCGCLMAALRFRLLVGSGARQSARLSASQCTFIFLQPVRASARRRFSCSKPQSSCPKPPGCP